MQETPQYLVGIGASAGGLDAIERFFSEMPTDTGMSFVVVQHLSPDFRSMMDELLARHTAIPIHKVKHELEIAPGGIYLIPPRMNMAISENRFRLTEQEPRKGLNLPIDIFFHSLAENFGEQSIAVVLSGTGSDGSKGIQSVHDAGGFVLVQDVETAGFDGMPRTAIATGTADVVCAPGRMAPNILRFIKSPVDFPRGQVEHSIDDSLEIDSDKIGLFRLFRQRYGIDFSLYKPATIDRRLERRVQLTRSQDLANYAVRLQDDPNELDLLYRDLLVEVTRFFRDTESFDLLRFEIIPEILHNHDGEVRVWVPGCATGEEAYSLAMLFYHVRAATKQDVDVKIFATDVHQRSLEAASTAAYQPESMQSVPDDFRELYFTRSGALWHINREIRETVVFAPHDLTKDPPFTRLDLISCRNVLIYFEPEVQRRVIAMFHFGLKTLGTLCLGPSETLGDLDREFDILDTQWRIFRKLRDVRLPEIARMPISSAMTGGIVSGRHPYRVASKAVGVVRQAPDVIEKLLTRYVPASFLVNQFHELVHSFGEARKFLSQPEGTPTLDVLRMVGGDLRTAMSAAIHRASEENMRVLYKNVRTRQEDGEIFINVAAEPFVRLNEKMFLVALEEIETPTEESTLSEEYDTESIIDQRLLNLESELTYTRESLQATVQELETSNEELQSTNEELVASHEELQSTNEELHSVNEELYTVNSEHQRKIEELNQVRADIEGLMRSTEIGIVFLDGDFRIRDFTSATTKLLHLIDQDAGRPIDHIAGNISTGLLIRDIKSAKDQAATIQKRIETKAGQPYLQRIVPYFADTAQIDGFVLTFTDLSAIEAATAHAKSSDRQLDQHQTLVYAISHDMQAPLRQLQEHVPRLVEALEADDPETLEVVTSRIERMGLMLNGLLEFSRVLTEGAAFVETDLSELFDYATSNNRNLIRSTEAIVTSEKLPTLHVDRAQIERALSELLKNALQYCEATPKIQVGAEKVQDSWILTISDNGIGISERHQESIFTVFRRLGFKTSIEGDGMGLPIARRIVERHGGTLSASSNDSGGSTLTVVLPAEIPN